MNFTLGSFCGLGWLWSLDLWTSYVMKSQHFPFYFGKDLPRLSLIMLPVFSFLQRRGTFRFHLKSWCKTPKALEQGFLHSEGEWAFLNTTMCLLRCIPELPNSPTRTQILIASAVGLPPQGRTSGIDPNISPYNVRHDEDFMKLPNYQSWALVSTQAQDIRGAALTCSFLASQSTKQPSLDRLAPKGPMRSPTQLTDTEGTHWCGFTPV